MGVEGESNGKKGISDESMKQFPKPLVDYQSSPVHPKSPVDPENLFESDENVVMVQCESAMDSQPQDGQENGEHAEEPEPEQVDKEELETQPKRQSSRRRMLSMVVEEKEEEEVEEEEEEVEEEAEEGGKPFPRGYLSKGLKKEIDSLVS